MGPYTSAPVPFVRHDETGRITERGRMEMQYIAAENADRGGILAGEGDAATHYVEDPTGPARRLRLRRNLVVGFNTNQPNPGTPARVTVPENSTITITGPVTATATGGGEVNLIFTVPGVYNVTVEAWPRRPATTTLTVPVTDDLLPTSPVAGIIVGPGIDAVRIRAKEILTNYYSELALKSRPTGLQAADLLKANEAAKVIAGEGSDWITEEAAERNVEPRTLADSILLESSKTINREKERVRAIGAINRAATESGVITALQALGLKFSMASQT